MSWLEQKYISMVGTRMRNFKRRGRAYNFSCPICGDSATKKREARGYILPKKIGYYYYCHNCGVTMPFPKFLNTIDINLYNEYLHEMLVENGRGKEAEAFLERLDPKKFKIDHDLFRKQKKISQLDSTHPAKKYVESRYIPTPFHGKIYWIPEFKKFVNSIIPNKFESTNYDSGRIIFPFINRKGDMYGFQGRSINPTENIRYITIMLDESQPRLFGIDSVDFNQNVYVFEGPIDSLFVKNSIASCGGELFRELSQIDLDRNNVTIVYDNEPRHPDTIKKMRHAINKGYKVCFWPNTVTEKDVNKMVQEKFKGKSYIPTENILEYGDEIRSMIDHCTKQGIDAEIELNTWQKIR